MAAADARLLLGTASWTDKPLIESGEFCFIFLEGKPGLAALLPAALFSVIAIILHMMPLIGADA